MEPNGPYEQSGDALPELGGTTISWASTPKWAVRRSGDALAVVPCAGDGVVAIIVDVQGSGSGAGRTASALVSLGGQIASEGGSAIDVASLLNRALWTRRGGRVQAGLAVAMWLPRQGVEVATYGSILVHAVGIEREAGGTASQPAGLDLSATPMTARLSNDVGTLVICSDGVATSAGSLEQLLPEIVATPSEADAILARAVDRDHGPPRDDMSVIVIRPDRSHHIRSGVRGRLDLTTRRSLRRQRADHED